MKYIKFKVKATVKEDDEFYDNEEVKFINSKEHDVISIHWITFAEGCQISNIVIPYNNSVIVLFKEYVDFNLEVVE